MQCAICGNDFRPSGHGKKQKYCSESCRNRSKYLRRKNASQQSHKQDNPAGKQTSPTQTIPEKQVASKTQNEFNRLEFERMMDDSIEEVLRMNRDRLKAALNDPDTPANALPNISKQLIAVCDRLNQMSGDDNLFDDIQDVEVTQNAGASII